jgi:hypothetical protein
MLVLVASESAMHYTCVRESTRLLHVHVMSALERTGAPLKASSMAEKLKERPCLLAAPARLPLHESLAFSCSQRGMSIWRTTESPSCYSAEEPVLPSVLLTSPTEVGSYLICWQA